MSKAKCKRKKQLRKAFIRLSGKIKYLVDELHKKSAKFLLDNFDILLLPTFEVSDMIKKTAKRKLRNKSVRQMLSLCHYKFKQYIKFKASCCGKLVVDVCEAYTSKTVSWTGEIIENLGGSKVIKSPSTGDKMIRDINAPRNIFIKTLVDTPELTNFVKINIC
jgi:putative transposase